MQLFNVLSTALLLASQATAVPITEPEALTPNDANLLTKRANPAPVSCGPSDNQRAWPLESVQDAFTALQTNGNLPGPQQPNAGGRTYPRQLGQGAQPPRDASVKAALDAIPECATSLAGSWKWFEFPITDPVFAGSQPAQAQGPDRVIAISQNIGPGGTRSYTYCLAVTHRGAATNGGFDPCTNAP